MDDDISMALRWRANEEAVNGDSARSREVVKLSCQQQQPNPGSAQRKLVSLL